MEFEAVVKARRSVRNFSSADVPDDLVRSLIDCAIRAPSSMNGQPWYFIKIRSGETKRRLAEIKDKYCPPEKREFPASFLMDAPVIVITCVDRSMAYDRGMESGILATGHLLLAAANHGLTGVYLSAYKIGTPEVADDIRKILNLPADVDPVTIVPIGYPGDTAEPKTLKHVEDVIFNETFCRK
ncbi:MAG: nitroreductase family protein [Candidatus Riflebacteria bacterium]|nr:nitroreductase family protein [Candidatus Riflebacteria bacterium]